MNLVFSWFGAIHKLVRLLMLDLDVVNLTQCFSKCGATTSGE